MPKIFSPAINLMNRLNYPGRLLVLGMMTLIATAILAFSLQVQINEHIEQSQQELLGLAQVKSLLHATQRVQEHRGLTTNYLAGLKSIQARIEAEEQETNDAFSLLENNLPAELRNSERWAKIKDTWESIRKNEYNWSSEKNFDEHNRLVSQMQSLVAIVADEYRLQLDPEMDTYYLIDSILHRFPDAIEHYGQLRALGARTLMARQANDQQKFLLVGLVAKLNNALISIDSNFELLGRHNPSFATLAASLDKEIDAWGSTDTQLVQSDILSGKFRTRPVDFFDQYTVSINKVYGIIDETLLPATQNLLKARIAREREQRNMTLGLVALLLLVAAYFIAGIYYSMVGTVKSLARSAERYAGGDFSERVHVQTHDELSIVADSFNAMADNLNTLLDDLHKSRSELELAASVFTHAREAIAITDAQGSVLSVNNAFTQITGYSRGEIAGQNMRILQSGRQDAAYYKAMWKGIVENGSWSGEIWNKRRDGSAYAEFLSISAVRDARGRITNYVGLFSDITEAKEHEDKLTHMAHYDALTGLPTRALFFDRLSKELANARRNNKRVALLFMDLDGFKPVNDEYGHQAGDEVLKIVARRWAGCVRESDTLARMGGDEFALILGNLDAAHEAEVVALKLIDTLAQVVQIAPGQGCRIGTSIGISIYPGNATEMDSLLAAADDAMYESKAGGKNSYTFTKVLAIPDNENAEWITFTNEHLVGVGVMDDQHRQLVRKVNRINQAICANQDKAAINQLFDDLIDYTLFHFKTEHQLMAQYGYPDIKTHDNEHNHLVKEVAHFQANIHHDIQGSEYVALQSIKDWLVGHILHSDKVLGEYLAAKGAQ